MRPGSRVFEFHMVNKHNTVNSVKNLDLSKSQHIRDANMKLAIKEKKLLTSINRNHLFKRERAKLMGIINITKFWMEHKFKRGEALLLLQNILKNYSSPEDRKKSKKSRKQYKKIPELDEGFKLMYFLQNEKEMGNFTSDDYYLTIEEQFDKLWERYFLVSQNKWEKFWEGFNNMKYFVEKNAKHVGDKIIHFELLNEKNEVLSTRKILENGPMVLSFYRGSWCPYCVNEMCVLFNSMPKFESLGATLVSLGPDLTAVKYFKKEGVFGNILVDKENKIAKKYGLVYEFTKGMRDVFMMMGIDLAKYNAGNPWEIPIPATYVVDMDGTITLDYVKMEHYKRLEPSKIAEALYHLFDKREKSLFLKENRILGKRDIFESKLLPSSKISDRRKKKVKIYDHTIEFPLPNLPKNENPNFQES